MEKLISTYQPQWNWKSLKSPELLTLQLQINQLYLTKFNLLIFRDWFMLLGTFERNDYHVRKCHDTNGGCIRKKRCASIDGSS